MNAVPAKVAGCRRLAMVVPTPDGDINPLVLAAARIAGVDEIYRVGGAQAIAALAYGTETIAAGGQDRRPRQRLCRGGQAARVRRRRHRYDRRARREVVVLADQSADPRFVAADLLAQAEHDEAAQSILITDDHGLARAVEAEVERQLDEPAAGQDRRRELARLWRDHSRARRSRPRIPLVDRLAPEHLEIIARRCRGAQPTRSPTPARSSLGPIRPRRSATMSAAPTTSCRPRARRAFPRAWRARLHQAHVDPQMRRQLACRLLARRRSRSAKPRGSQAHARSVALRLRANSP